MYLQVLPDYSILWKLKSMINLLVMNKIFSFFKKLTASLGLSKKSSKPEEIVPAEVIQKGPTEISRKPGLSCPRCEARMPISIPMLLSGEPIYCPDCKLKIEVDRDKSSKTLGSLEKLNSRLNHASAVAKGR